MLPNPWKVIQALYKDPTVRIIVGAVAVAVVFALWRGVRPDEGPPLDAVGWGCVIVASFIVAMRQAEAAIIEMRRKGLYRRACEELSEEVHEWVGGVLSAYHLRILAKMSLPRFSGHLECGDEVAQKGVQDGQTISPGVPSAGGQDPKIAGRGLAHSSISWDRLDFVAHNAILVCDHADP